MLEIEIPLPRNLPPDEVPGAVESACVELGLDLARRGTLKTFPDSIHWHYKKGKQRGSLEITWWAEGPRLWIKVAGGRQADWIDEAIPLLKARIQAYNRPN